MPENWPPLRYLETLATLAEACRSELLRELYHAESKQEWQEYLCFLADAACVYLPASSSDAVVDIWDDKLNQFAAFIADGRLALHANRSAVTTTYRALHEVELAQGVLAECRAGLIPYVNDAALRSFTPDDAVVLTRDVVATLATRAAQRLREAIEHGSDACRNRSSRALYLATLLARVRGTNGSVAELIESCTWLHRRAYERMQPDFPRRAILLRLTGLSKLATGEASYGRVA